jgi:hypothetical protein
MFERQRWRPVVVVAVAVALVATLGVAGVTALASPPEAGSATRSHEGHLTSASHGGSAKKLAFHDAMRKLWEDHITWTRLFIVSFAADLPDLQPTTARLLRNQVDIGNAIRPFYGDAAGDRLTELLTEHITTAAELLAAAKAGDDPAFAEAHDAWYRNARAIARFLAAANPRFWPFEEMRSMMREHLDSTLAEAGHHLAGRYGADIAAYDRVHRQILEMADMLSDGIIRQFPNRFA